MALVWALIILENDIVARYFEVVKYDDNMRPLMLKSLDYGSTSKIINPVGLFTNEADGSSNQPIPILFDTGDQGLDERYYSSDDMSELYGQGWRFPDINKL
jgi:hypothetical protein